VLAADVSARQVMKVLRENRDSLMAMLEAFVHDPLIGWKLINAEENKSTVCLQTAPSVVP
jgi:FKBP12-rapamycin complex-associated protein